MGCHHWYGLLAYHFQLIAVISCPVQFHDTFWGHTRSIGKTDGDSQAGCTQAKGAKCWDGLGNFKGLDRTGKIGEIFENTRFESWLWGEHEHILFHRFTLAAGPFVGWFKWTSKATGSRWNPNRVAIELLEQHFSLPVIHGLDIEGIGYGSIPINTIFNGMNIQINQLFWGSAGVPGFWPIPNSESSHSAGLPTRLPQLGLCAGQWKGQRGEQWDWSNNDWGDIWTRK